jgi:hypothetical protein
MDLQKVIWYSGGSQTERIILCLSPFVTDDPASIPILKKLNFLKGAGVTNRRIWK